MGMSAQKREAEVRGHKDRAAQLLGKNKLEPALGSLTAALALSPHDTTLRQKQAEVLVRLNRKDEAVRAYQHVVGAWADEGHLLRAIAICKVILQLDARHTETQNALADLYARHRGGHVASVPAA